MRTNQEILDHYRKIEDEDFFGYAAAILLCRLPFEAAREFLIADAKSENWKTEQADEQTILSEMKSYMKFAWRKVIDHRGVSALRSVEKMKAWLWLMGDDELLYSVNTDENYTQYGAPILMRICEKYGFEIPQNNAIKRMSQGLPCYEDCDMGCEK